MTPRLNSSQKKTSLSQITRNSFLLICFFFLLWCIISSFYFEQEELLSDKDEETLTEVHLTSPSTLSSNTTITTIADNNKNLLEELNKKYCSKPICKFLFVYFIGEQETKANLHFRSFSQLAEKLNRIMVLPNVGSSRIGTCNKFPFDFYYNITLLQKEFPNVLFKSENDFIYWLKERDQIKKLKNNNNNKIIPSLSILHSSIKINRNGEKSLYDDAEPNFDVHECILKFEPLMNLKDPNSRVKYTKMIIKEMDLRREKSRVKISKFLTKVLTIDEEIILVNGYVVNPLFPQIMPVIPYSDYLLNEAQKIKDKLSSSYIGIHWRLETSTPKLLPECVQGLIKTLNKVIEEGRIKNIYLATDYPLLSSRSQSSTFRNITNYHHDAIRILNETFKINTWVSLEGLEQLRKNKKYNKELNGSGIQGILDKLVCINSNYFISGPKGCSRVISKYTKAIADERKNRIKNKDSGLLNIIDRWEIPL